MEDEGIITCEKCQGSGEVECNFCGNGTVPCEECDGLGEVEKVN